jgi:uncharacterized protein DUF1697
MLRTAQEAAAILRSNPFPKSAPNRTVVIFLDAPPPPAALEGVRGRTDERVQVRKNS